MTLTTRGRAGCGCPRAPSTSWAITGRVSARSTRWLSPTGIHPSAPRRVRVSWLADELGPEFLVGDPSRNYHLPTAVGALRPTALAQPSMVAGDAVGGKSYAVVGVRQLKDFPADLIAGNLARSTAPDGGKLSAHADWISLPARKGEADPTALTYARAMDDQSFAAAFAKAVAAVRERRRGPARSARITRRDVWRQLAGPSARRLSPAVGAGPQLYDALLAMAAGRAVHPGQPDHGLHRRRRPGLSDPGLRRPPRPRAGSFVFAPGGSSGALDVDSTAPSASPSSLP